MMINWYFKVGEKKSKDSKQNKTEFNLSSDDEGDVEEEKSFTKD